jgi:PAS domain S-box-containing protein
MARNSGRILIVEDEMIVAHSIQMRLELYGYEVVGLANSGDAALAMLDETDPDLILMDIRLSGDLDGIRAAEEVRKVRDVPVIFLTAYSDDATLARAKITEPFGYIIKPFETRELVNNIEIALYRKAMADQLSASESRFRALFDNAVIGLVLIDEDGSIVEVNRTLLAMMGYNREAAMQPDGPISALVVPHENTSSSPDPNGRPHQRAVEVAVETADGETRLFSVTSAEIPRGPNSAPFTARFVEDVTELRNYERDLHERQQALRMLFVNEEGIREQERTRLSRDIHDVLGQMLTALKMDLHWLNSHDGNKDAGDTVGEMIGQVDDMIQFVKKVCSELRDNVLDVFGFSVSLDEHLKQFEQRTSIAVEYMNSCEDIDLPPEAAVALLRIIQESLTNVARHANATRVHVESDCADGRLRWSIRDNGVGFDADSQELARSLGLVGMKERAFSLNGSVTVSSAPGDGTEVTVEIPVHEQVAQ